MRLPVVLALASLAACSSKKKDETPQEQQQEHPTVGALVHGDAGITGVVTSVEPGAMHMDDDGAPQPVQAQPQPARAGRPIDVTLRSTPPGAQVAVDGTVIGNTPAFWSGTADGREHEFVFTMRGYAIARYRFVPVASGVIHGKLDVIHEETDAGVPTPPPEVVPPRPPTSPTVNAPTAPPTITNDAPPPVPDSGSSPVGPQP
jgi:hypothetical protein